MTGVDLGQLGALQESDALKTALLRAAALCLRNLGRASEAKILLQLFLVFFGFPFADVPDVGMTIQVLTNVARFSRALPSSISSSWTTW